VGLVEEKNSKPSREKELNRVKRGLKRKKEIVGVGYTIKKARTV